MSNGLMHVVASGREILEWALVGAMTLDPKPVGWGETENGLQIYWTDRHAVFNPFLGLQSASMLADQVEAWLGSLSGQQHDKLAGPRPDIDGDVERGAFEIRAGDQASGVLATIKPVWLERHK